ncbi:MAG: DUF4870 domain-containing protein [Pirellulales bacterium]|nr:DUF4870 domain-containing protein [Pirellulales bacterium]
MPSTSPREFDAEERNWAMICHLSAFAVAVCPPVGHLLGPLAVWLLKRDEFPLVDDQGRESLNFQITMTLYYGIGLLLLYSGGGYPLLAALGAWNIVATIMAAARASRGVRFRYLLAIRFLR